MRKPAIRKDLDLRREAAAMPLGVARHTAKMEIKHHHRRCEELLDEWWAEAGMTGFAPLSSAYKFEPTEGLLVVAVRDIGPVYREPLFRDEEGGLTAKERVINILNGFRLGQALPPVAVVAGRDSYPYKLTAGVHRLYCSIAVRFTHIPTVPGFDRDNRANAR
jgi:hypothetical protein